MKVTRRKLTLKDVAKVLSISPSTISKALRDSNDIFSNMKEFVRAKTDKMGYRPNFLARNIINNSSKLFSVMIPDMRISFTANSNILKTCFRFHYKEIFY